MQIILQLKYNLVERFFTFFFSYYEIVGLS